MNSKQYKVSAISDDLLDATFYSWARLTGREYMADNPVLINKTPLEVAMENTQTAAEIKKRMPELGVGDILRAMGYIKEVGENSSLSLKSRRLFSIFAVCLLSRTFPNDTLRDIVWWVWCFITEMSQASNQTATPTSYRNTRGPGWSNMLALVRVFNEAYGGDESWDAGADGETVYLICMDLILNKVPHLLERHDEMALPFVITSCDGSELDINEVNMPVDERVVKYALDLAGDVKKMSVWKKINTRVKGGL